MLHKNIKKKFFVNLYYNKRAVCLSHFVTFLRNFNVSWYVTSYYTYIFVYIHQCYDTSK